MQRHKDLLCSRREGVWMYTGVKRRDTGVNKKTIQPVHVCKGRAAASSSLNRATIPV